MLQVLALFSERTSRQQTLLKKVAVTLQGPQGSSPSGDPGHALIENFGI